MLQQFAGKPLSTNKEEYLNISQEFSLLPIKFLKFYGSTDVDEVLNSMDYAVYTHDVQHIV